MDRESINRRVLEAIGYLLNSNKLINKSSLASRFGISASKFSEILNNRMKAGPDIMAVLAKDYNISPNYLLTGEGNMIESSKTEVAREHTIPVVEQNIMSEPQTHYGDHNSTKMIPLIPLEAFAGYSPAQFPDIPVEDFYHITEFNQADFLIRVKGDSMTPRFNGGDIVACKKLLERLFFQWHRIYVIYTRSQGVMIKRVEQSERENYIKLVSDNPNYSPFEIPEADIADIALVLGAITLE